MKKIFVLILITLTFYQLSCIVLDWNITNGTNETMHVSISSIGLGSGDVTRSIDVKPNETQKFQPRGLVYGFAAKTDSGKSGKILKPARGAADVIISIDNDKITFVSTNVIN